MNSDTCLSYFGKSVYKVEFTILLQKKKKKKKYKKTINLYPIIHRSTIFPDQAVIFQHSLGL